MKSEPMRTDANPESDVRTAAANRSPSSGDPRSQAEPAATAIVVWHGMGQQLPSETIELVAKALAARQARSAGGAQQGIVTRTVLLGQRWLRRAELDLAEGGRVRRVHIYEGYWAPLTQGRITLAETISFLFTAGWLGLRASVRGPRAFQRYLFDQWVSFPLKPSLLVVYAYLLATVAALVMVNVVITTALGLKLLTGPGLPEQWPSYALFASLSVDLAWLALPFALLAATLHAVNRRERPNRLGTLTSQPIRWVRVLIWLLIALSSIATVVVGGFVLLDVLRYSFTTTTPRQWPVWINEAFDVLGDRGTLVFYAALWLTVLLASWRVRWFLLEFVGDSAIYVTSHTLNRYFETRETIKKDALDLLRAIYQFGRYERHILVGHSLGSVIAYDALNAVLNDDSMSDGALCVAPRTGLLLTFASILDKTAFLFRAQSEAGEIREALASTSQPLISDPAARPRWVNLYSPADVLGGPLEYYDLPPGLTPPSPPTPHRIENIADPHSWIPLLAHTQFWHNELFLSTIASAVVSDAPAARGQDDSHQ